MIGGADTKAARPYSPPFAPGYAKGATSGLNLKTRVRGLSKIFDSFNNTNNWINVYGRLAISGGNVIATGLSYSAGYHKTQLLSDNCRAKVTLQSGSVILGESRVVICADPRFNRYYGLAIRKGLLSSEVSIVRGLSSISVQKFETTTVTLTAGDEFEVWYDRVNSTVRAYQNGSEIAAKYFEPNDIPHGPGARYTGVVMGTNWIIDTGPNFTDFEAEDVTDPNPVVYDPVDSLTVDPDWTAVLNTVAVNRNFLQPLSLGPNNATTAAVRWADEMGTNSVKVVFSVYRFGSGKFTVAVRSNAAMTNFIGVQFDTATNTIYAVTGTGPVTVTARGTAASRATVSTGQQYTITYDDATETIRCYRGASRVPIVEWAAGANFTASGKYVGMSWNRASAGVKAVEPTVFEAYDDDYPFIEPGS